MSIRGGVFPSNSMSFARQLKLRVVRAITRAKPTTEDDAVRTLTRMFPMEHAHTEVNFQWDSGDPSVNIFAGWGENTGAVVKAGSFTIYVVFLVDDQEPVPAWRVETIETMIHSENHQESHHIGSLNGGLTLSELPEICQAVELAWEQIQAHDQIECAKESVWDVESEISDLQEAWREVDELDPDNRRARAPARQARLQALQEDLAEVKTAAERLQTAYDAKYGHGMTA